ncbi:MAG: 2-oxoacid:acceptor oxidoreductase subunit alpha [Candidatus Omnitrophica bacterium]|nr:2-oxoacid:acceptor oxidoreductase subunit alpha [Candidatus Omnitrophota bacterium]
MSDYVFRFGGEGGEGVISTGDLFTTACARSGLEIYTFRSYPAEIKGGHAMIQVRVADRNVLLSRGDEVDVLIAFNKEAYDRHVKELKPGGVLLFDNTDFLPAEDLKAVKYPVPFTKIAMEEIGVRLTKNMVALGSLSGLFGIPLDKFKELIRDKFGKKGEQVLQKNFLALEAGHRYATENLKKQESVQLKPTGRKPKLVLSGNESLCLGAIAAGLKVYAGYPITPASSILEFLAKELPKAGGVVIQTEDEIAALGVVLGASFAGKKAMTATSGPGFSLMVEMLGLAVMAELPAVIIDAQRAGPSTGMPTKAEQADLMMAIYAGHGEAPRVVLGLTSVEDCFYGIIRAFNIAETFQTPVIILSDQGLAQREASILKPETNDIDILERRKPSSEELGEYQRFKMTEDFISPMSVPGMPEGFYAATGIEHTEAGGLNYEPANHNRMMEKRSKKLEGVLKYPWAVKTYGAEHPEVAVIGWGSGEGVIREVVEQATAAGLKVGALHPKILWPFPTQIINDYLANGTRRIVVPELNYSGQFAALLKQHMKRTDIEVISMAKGGGIPWKPGEILSTVKEACLPAGGR